MRELGKGAMGVVYLGRDPVIGRMVALKTIRVATEDDQEAREFGERFLREAQAAGILSHPNIVTVHDVGEDPETHTSFIAMEYVEGKNLKQLLQERSPFTFERVAEIIGQVAEALDYAHRRGIVHRDVKPANVIITPEGAVKITDFGIAKIESSTLTSDGQFLGTPNYMSPEQVTGEAVDGRSDLFSLGVVLYELLTRKKPFTADNLTSISYKIVHESFTPPDTYDASIPPEFAGVLGKALAKDPAERFQRGNDFALALYEFKAREEERQMLRDLGQMVAEAEKLGPIQAVNAPSPSFPPAPAAPMPRPAEPPVSEYGSPLTVPVDWARLPVSAPAPAPDEPAPEEAVEASAPDWALEGDEPAAGDAGFVPGTEIVQAGFAPAPAPRAESTADRPQRPPAPVLSGRDAPTELLRAVAPPAPPSVPARSGFDAPTELLMPAIRPPETPAPPAPSPRYGADAPTELLMAAIPPPPAPSRAGADAPTQLLAAPPGGFAAAARASESEAGRPSVELGRDGRTEILPAWAVSELASKLPGAPAPPAPREPEPEPEPEPLEAAEPPEPQRARPQADVAPAIEPDLESRPTEIITDAAALARLGLPRSTPAPPPPPPLHEPEPLLEEPPEPVYVSPPAPPPPPPPEAPPAGPYGLPEVQLEPLPPPAPRAPAPPPAPGKGVPVAVWAAIGAVVVILAVVIGGVQYRKSVQQKELAVVAEGQAREAAERQALMDKGGSLLAAGKPQEALEAFRELVRRDPAFEPARQAVQQAEVAVAQLQAAQAQTQELESRLAAARSAAATGDDARAVAEADAALALDPANAGAAQIRADAEARAAAAAKATEDQKKAAEAKKRRPTAVPTLAVRVAAKPAEPTPTPIPQPTATTGTLRISLSSPVNDGYVMVRLNNREVFRKAFDFGKKGRGGLVEGSVSVPSGAGEFKVWVIATDRSVSEYQTLQAVVPGGETRTLKLEFDAANKLHVAVR